MSSRQPVRVGSMPPYIERKCSETIDRCTVTASRELKELLLLHFCHILMDDFPEPFDNFAVLFIAINIASGSLKLLEVKYL